LNKVSHLIKKGSAVFGGEFGSGVIATQHNVPHCGHGYRAGSLLTAKVRRLA
jgi:hypothetical protein